jgi:endonuclease YncB( thermonuclease family)
MQLRETLLNLAITSVLVLIVALVAVLLRESRPGPVAAIPIAVAQPTLEPEQVRTSGPEFDRLMDVAFVDSRANEADTLRFRIGRKEEVFRLYYIDALEASWTHPQRIAEQSRYFGHASREDVVAVGEEAVRYVAQLLATKPYQVLTRWESVPNLARYYALIIVEMKPGEWVYLSDLLIQKGFARLNGVTTYLPEDSRSIETYIHELQGLARDARSQKRGIWAKVQDS